MTVCPGRKASSPSTASASCGRTQTSTTAARSTTAWLRSATWTVAWRAASCRARAALRGERWIVPRPRPSTMASAIDPTPTIPSSIALRLPLDGAADRGGDRDRGHRRRRVAGRSGGDGGLVGGDGLGVGKVVEDVAADADDGVHGRHGGGRGHGRGGGHALRLGGDGGGDRALGLRAAGVWGGGRGGPGGGGGGRGGGQGGGGAWGCPPPIRARG